jgi:hypothetical protein
MPSLELFDCGLKFGRQEGGLEPSSNQTGSGEQFKLLPPVFIGGSAPNAQVRFPVSAADEMQNERHHGHDKKNMNQPARHMKKYPARKPGNH